MLSLGNENVNAFREGNNTIGGKKSPKKPTPRSSRTSKAEWITLKYALKTNPINVNDNNIKMFKAASDCNPVKLAEELANGGNVHYKDQRDGRTALHICVLGEFKGDRYSSEDKHRQYVVKRIACAELLVKNGAKVSALDNNMENVLDCAYRHNVEREILRYLSYTLKKTSSP